MQLHFCLNASGNRLLGKDVGEIVGDFIRIHLFYLTARKFDKALKTGNIGLTASNSDQVDKDATLFG